MPSRSVFSAVSGAPARTSTNAIVIALAAALTSRPASRSPCHAAANKSRAASTRPRIASSLPMDISSTGPLHELRSRRRASPRRRASLRRHGAGPTAIVLCAVRVASVRRAARRPPLARAPRHGMRAAVARRDRSAIHSFAHSSHSTMGQSELVPGSLEDRPGRARCSPSRGLR